MSRVVAIVLTVLALAPAGASATTGGTGAPVGGTGSSATGGTTVDPDWVPSGGGGPAGGTATDYQPPRSPAEGKPVRSFARTDIPHAYLKLYRQAGRLYRVDWRLLAALGKNESDHGRAQLPGVADGLNFADCCAGPMQICTVESCGNVWLAYGRDGNGDGVVSIYEPADSIHAAAALVADLRALVGPSSRLIMAAYNAGPGTVQRYRGVPPYDETVLYVRNGVRYLRALRG